MKTATLVVKAIKLTIVVAANQLPRDLVPMDGPVEDPMLEVILADAPQETRARARLNGKNYRRMLKQVDQQGPENVVIVFQGRVYRENGEFRIDEAGFIVSPKKRKDEPQGGGAAMSP